MSRIPYKTFLSGLALGLAFAFPALAAEISISGQVAHVEEDDEHGTRIEIFMTIDNSGAADRVYAVRSKVAKTGQMSGGVDKRSSAGHNDHLIATVVDVPAKGRTVMDEEGRHIELTGLKKTVEVGDTIQITLFFEKAGRVKIDVPVEAEDH